MSRNIIKKLVILLVLPLGLMSSGFCYVFAAENTEEAEIINPEYYIYLDKATIAKGYTVNAFDELKLSLVPGILDQDTGVDVIKINEDIESPWQFDRISNIYQFEFRNKEAYDNHKPFYIQFSYLQDSPDYKQVFFYDKNYATWRPLPTTDYPEENFVRSLIHLPFARIAIFSNPEKLTIGKASWYRYKGGNYAASPDFPKGSVLRVFNLDYNNTSGLSPYVDVEINDYGPDRNLHPDRVVDLDLVAFQKIAKKSQGIINIRIEPISIASEEKQVLGVKITNANIEPNIESKAAVVIDEQTGKIIYEKNSDDVLPIASLTKLVAVRTFLEYNDNLDQIVNYSVKDEEYNYQYCSKWESAKVNLGDGDQIKIQDLIYSSLVRSANNAVETLVRVSGIARQDFIKKMNENARIWGAKSTNFVEPTGLSPENRSTAYDYAIISREALKNPLVKNISITPRYEFYSLNDGQKHSFLNTNTIFNRGTSLNITGSKTGYLHEAGACLMVRAQEEGKSLLAVILGADSRTDSINEIEDLIKYSAKITN